MRSNAAKVCIALVLVGVLSACGGGPRPYSTPKVPSAGEQKVGKPYRIGGIWYYPSYDNDYDEVGIASWYGPKFHGRPTANGERFDMNKVTAAHPTLPLPSVVRVTNMDNGRTLKVRVNDRGPFARGRLIDLSRRAAQLLGFEKNGTARVRVQLVRSDGSIANGRQKTAPRRVAADEVISGPLYVQVGAFGNYENAQKLREQLSSLGKVAIESGLYENGQIFRVRIGPFEDENSARHMLDRVRKRGFYEARIFTDRLG